MSATKQGYEPIPDIEKGASHAQTTARESYSDLDDEQADLINSFDKAIEGASINLSLPTISEDDLVSQGRSLIQGLLAPTLASGCTFAAALYISGTAQVSHVSALLAQLFPYLNAVVVFFSTLNPIQDRFMKAVVPVFTKVDKAEDIVNTSINDVKDSVDTTIDSLQAKLGKVMKPMKPTLEKAKSNGAALKRLDPDIEIPDPDVDKELDGKQGVVGAKIEEAQKHLQLDKHVPEYLRSPESFYWRVVFPVVILVLIVQLLFAWLGTYCQSAAGGTRMLKELESLKTAAHGQIEGFKGGFQDNVAGYEGEFKDFGDQFKGGVASSKPLLINVATSYMIALFQLSLIYLLTNPGVRAWVVNKVLHAMSNEAMRRLREYGATAAVEDVMGTRMAGVRAKVLVTIRQYKKIEGMLAKVTGVGALAAGTKSAPSPSASSPDRIRERSPGGLLGRIFSPRSPKTSPNR